MAMTIVPAAPLLLLDETTETTFTDSGGYTALLEAVSDQITLTGYGPRGGRLGRIVLRSEAQALALADVFGDLAAAIIQGGADGPSPTGKSLSPICLVVSDPDAPHGRIAWIYLPGPRGGYRRPLEIADPSSLDEIAAQLKALAPAIDWVG